MTREESAKPSADWYFDFVSPFSYLQFAAELPRLRERLDITLVPVLFAGLLNHWGQKGPAEIPPKRVFTFQFCAWSAGKRGVPFRLPPRHPFNPLGALRLAVALDAREDAVAGIFRFIWGEGHDASDPAEWAALAHRLGVADADALVARDDVKRRLRDNTERAVAAGAYGVPTLAVGGRTFWGADATGMVHDYLDDPAHFEQGEIS